MSKGLKKLLAIIVLGFLWFNTSYAENTSNIASQLEQLNDLYKSGTLTKDEFNKAKKKLLNPGEIKNNKQRNQVTKKYDDGSKYVGELKNGKRHGQGTYTWPEGEKHIGEWKNDKANGQGTFIWPDGAKHVGEFKNNKSHGQGTLTETDGTVQSGKFKNDKFMGK